MTEPKEPRNLFYFLLLLASLVFTINAVALALIPIIEEKARDAGAAVPSDPFRDALRTDGWRWLLYEVGAIIVFGLLSMGLDRLRRLQKERAQATMPPATDTSPPP